MDVAVVTGASSSAGLSVARKLVAMGLRVYGLDADFSNCSWEHPEFQRVECDLFRQEKIALAWKEIVGRDPGVSILVHAAMAKLEGPLEAAHPDDIRRALEARLMGPALLTRYALPRLIRIRGSVFFVNRRGGNATSEMIEGGIASLTDGLYAEVRDTGVKVCQIALEVNDEPGDDEGRHTRIDPDSVAVAVESVLRLPEHNSVTRLILRPQATREEPFAAASTPLLRWGPDEVRLPEPENFPPEPEPIYTPPRQRPVDAPPPEEDDDDEFEDEDDELDRLLEESRQRLKNQIDRQRQSDRGRQQHPPRERQQGQQPGGESGEGEGGRKKKRRRGRRRGRNRNRDREQGAPNAGGESSSQQRPAEPRRPDGEATRQDSGQAPTETSSPKPEPKPEAAPRESPTAAESKPKKKAAKKATKKAVKKAAKKAVKKAAKKAVKKTANKEPKPETES